MRTLKVGMILAWESCYKERCHEKLSQRRTSRRFHPAYVVLGPLSVTVLTPSELRITDVLGNTRQVAQQIAASEPVEELIVGISSLRKAETVISLHSIRSFRWIKRNTGLRIEYDDEQGRSLAKTTYIQKNAIRLQLVDLIEQVIGHQFQRRQEPTGFWKLA